MRGIGVGLVLAAAVGCAPSGPATVSGTVTYDGHPLENGTIGFYPDRGGPPQFTAITAGGRFELAPVAGDVPLMSGGYRVTVNGTEAPRPGKGGPPGPGRPVTPHRFADRNESGLRCMLDPGPNTITFALPKE
jgi:hypothetical protein